MSIAIKAQDLVKQFEVPVRAGESLRDRLKNFLKPSCKKVNVLNGISFNVREGEIVGYLGPNGAGKSTTVKILTGILTPTSGYAEVMGCIPYKQRYENAYNCGVFFGQRSLLWFHVPVIDCLKLYKEIYGLTKDEFNERIAFFSEILGIDKLLHIPVRKLSLGQRIRCELAAALIHKPRVLFLDEPTIGLDVIVKERLREFILKLNEVEKTTVFLSSHDMLDVEHLCKRVIIIDKGRIIYDGSLEELTHEYTDQKIIYIEYSKIYDQSKFKSIIDLCEILEMKDYCCKLLVNVRESSVTEIVRDLMTCCSVRDVSVHGYSLEDVIRVLYRKRGVES